MEQEDAFPSKKVKSSIARKRRSRLDNSEYVNVMSFLDWLLTPTAPGATVAILLLAMIVSFFIQLLNRLLTNREQLGTWRQEIATWTSDYNKAKRSGDKKLLAKVQRQQPRIMKLQSKMMWQSTKVMIITLVPILLMWQLLTGFYRDLPVAYFPGFGELNIIWWYMLCSFTFGALFTRLFGMGMGAST